MMNRILYSVIYIALIPTCFFDPENEEYCTDPNDGLSCYSGPPPPHLTILVCNDPSACNFYDEPTGECYQYSEDACLYDNECDEYTTTG